MRTLLGYLVLLVTFGRPAHAQNCPQIATNLRIDPTQTIGGSSNSIIGGKPYPIVQVTFTLPCGGGYLMTVSSPYPSYAFNFRRPGDYHLSSTVTEQLDTGPVPAPTPVTVMVQGLEGSPLTATIMVLPFDPHLSIAPSQITGGTGEKAIGTFDLGAPLLFSSMHIMWKVDPPSDLISIRPLTVFSSYECLPTDCLFVGGPTGTDRWKFEISTTRAVNQQTTFTFTVGSFDFQISRTAKLTILPNATQFQLEIFKDDGSNTNSPALSKFKFDSSRAEVTSNAQRVKLGQLFTARIVPLNADGTDGSPVTLTETISDAVPDSFPISPIPTLSGASGTDLFLDKVLLHFPKSTTAPQHQYFGIHGGPATLNLGFQSGNSPLTVHVPIQVVTCTDSSSSCSPALGSGPADFDQEIMLEADIRGIPPQLIKAQIGQESSFNPNAYRYEPLSIDFASVGLSPAQLKDKRLAPWRLATSSDCATIPADLAQGTSLDLRTQNATSRQRFKVQLDAQSAPLCSVVDVDRGESTRNILPSDALISMENILYTNNSRNN